MEFHDSIRGFILNSHRKIEKWSEQKLRQTRRRTQAGLTPGKDDNEVWHHFCRSRLKVSMGVQYYDSSRVNGIIPSRWLLT